MITACISVYPRSLSRRLCLSRAWFRMSNGVWWVTCAYIGISMLSNEITCVRKKLFETQEKNIFFRQINVNETRLYLFIFLTEQQFRCRMFITKNNMFDTMAHVAPRTNNLSSRIALFIYLPHLSPHFRFAGWACEFAFEGGRIQNS